MGYIETWGRGIQKIFDACNAVDEEPPRYELRVHFKALERKCIDRRE